MSKLRVHNVAVSIDGFMAGPDQSLENPLGVGAEALHGWVFETRTGRAMMGLEGGSTGVDDRFMQLGIEGIGATIMGRNMFGPVRGEWPDHSWAGWWGEDPPYHHHVFVLTHHARPALEMEGGTTFHFVTDGPQVALDLARRHAAGRDIRIGGGASTIQGYLRSGLVDDLHCAIVPVVLGGGERLFDHVGRLDGYECAELVSSDAVLHVRFERRTGARRPAV